MISLILNLLVSAVLMIVISKVLPGFEIKDFKTSIIVALVFGILMALGGLLAAPLSFLNGIIVSVLGWISTGIASFAGKILAFLLQFIIGSIMLCITDHFIDGFKLRSFSVGIVAAFLIALVNAFLPTF